MCGPACLQTRARACERASVPCLCTLARFVRLSCFFALCSCVYLSEPLRAAWWFLYNQPFIMAMETGRLASASAISWCVSSRGLTMLEGDSSFLPGSRRKARTEEGSEMRQAKCQIQRRGHTARCVSRSCSYSYVLVRSHCRRDVIAVTRYRMAMNRSNRLYKASSFLGPCSE